MKKRLSTISSSLPTPPGLPAAGGNGETPLNPPSEGGGRKGGGETGGLRGVSGSCLGQKGRPAMAQLGQRLPFSPSIKKQRRSSGGRVIGLFDFMTSPKMIRYKRLSI